MPRLPADIRISLKKRGEHADSLLRIGVHTAGGDRRARNVPVRAQKIFTSVLNWPGHALGARWIRTPCDEDTITDTFCSAIRSLRWG